MPQRSLIDSTSASPQPPGRSGVVGDLEAGPLVGDLQPHVLRVPGHRQLDPVVLARAPVQDAVAHDLAGEQPRLVGAFLGQDETDRGSDDLPGPGRRLRTAGHLESCSSLHHHPLHERYPREELAASRPPRGTRALPPQRHVVGVDGVVDPAREAMDRGLQPLVLEGRDLRRSGRTRCGGDGGRPAGRARNGPGPRPRRPAARASSAPAARACGRRSPARSSCRGAGARS